MYPQSHCFGHYPKLMTIREGWNIDQMVNLKLCLSIPFIPNGPIQHLYYCWCRIKVPVHHILHFPITREDAKIFDPLPVGQQLPPTWMQQSTIAWRRTMAYYLEVLILILVLHAQLQCMLKVADWWSQQNRSIFKKKGHQGHNSGHSPQSAVLEILSIMSQTGQPWWSPPTAENLSHFVIHQGESKMTTGQKWSVITKCHCLPGEGRI